jgi:fatty-acid desaturase
LDWFYQGLWHINNLVGRVLRAISTIIEGDGGLLWTILLLVLLISLLTTTLNGLL